MRRKLTCQGHCALSEKEGRKKEKYESGGRKKGGVKKTRNKKRERKTERKEERDYNTIGK